jgi:ribosome-associated heat shock protein Hsp15
MRPRNVEPNVEPLSAAPRVRFDLWLWAARFYRTRSLAAQAIDAGQARLCGERAKPAHPVRAGDVVSVRKEGLVWIVDVTAVADRRGDATFAATIYREQPQSVAARAEETLQRRAAAAAAPRFAGRPTKRQRRKLADFLNEP